MKLYTFYCLTQGLYEYVCPTWQERPRPSVEDFDVKTFGSAVPAYVLSPNNNPVKVAGKESKDGVTKPRFLIKLAQYSILAILN
jgi:hypothetical protein